MEREYTIEDWYKAMMEEGNSGYEEIDRYSIHYFKALSKAFEIHSDRLFERPEYHFLEALTKAIKNLRTPTHGFLEAGLAYSKFPMMHEIDNVYVQQNASFKTLFHSILKHEFPDQYDRVFTKPELITYGYNPGLEPDYSRIYDED